MKTSDSGHTVHLWKQSIEHVMLIESVIITNLLIRVSVGQLGHSGLAIAISKTKTGG